jgi:hypothetical protein
MEQFNITTDAGNLELAPATTDELKTIAAQWPMGIVAKQGDTDPWGLVFQVGDHEAYGIKLQSPEVDEGTAKVRFFMNQALIAAALPFYLEHHHQGIMLPCAYYKEKGHGRVESGFAFFVSSHPTSKMAARTKAEIQYDDRLGDGASKMIFDMAAAIGKASAQIHVPLSTIIGIDLRPRLALGLLSMRFLVQSARTFLVQHPLLKEHPVWGYAVRAGLSKLPYAPMVPTAVPGRPSGNLGWQARVKMLSDRLLGASLEGA